MKIARFSLRIRLVFGLLLLWAFSTLVSSPLIRVDWSKQERNSREASLNDVALTEKKGSKDDANFVIATAVCGDRAVEEFLVLVKSALYFSNVTIKFIVFADKLTMKTMRQITRHWPANSPILSSSFNHQFDLRPIQFPDKLSGEWRNLYKPCASQRLFFPVIRILKYKILFTFYKYLFFKKLYNSEFVGGYRFGIVFGYGQYFPCVT